LGMVPLLRNKKAPPMKGEAVRGMIR
jgi:hypothetical protein